MSLKKTQLKTKITIPINFSSSDYGFSDLRTKKVFNFLLSNLKAGNNLINSQINTYITFNGKNQLKLQAQKHKNWKFADTWTNIKCKEINERIKTSPCSIGSSRDKIFYKLESNEKIAGFALYLMAVNMNLISLEDHKEFIMNCKKLFKKQQVYSENTDVQWLHLVSKKK